MSGQVPLMTLGEALENPTIELLQIGRLYSTAVYGAVVWEWITTWRGEHKFWQEKWTLLKAFFLIQRYWTLVTGAVFLAYADGMWPIESCENAHTIRQILATGILFWADAILLTRCYALWGRSKIIGVGGIILLIGQIVIIYVSAIRSTMTLPFPVGADRFACLIGANKAMGKLPLAQWLYPWGVDCLVTALTSYRVIAFRKQGARSGLLTAFLRDGIAYFFLISIIESINLGFVIQSRNKILSRISGLPTFLFTSMIVQRLALSLRLGGGPTGATNYGTTSKSSTMGPRTGTASQMTDIHMRVPNTPSAYPYPAYPPSHSPSLHSPQYIPASGMKQDVRVNMHHQMDDDEGVPTYVVPWSPQRSPR